MTKEAPMFAKHPSVVFGWNVPDWLTPGAKSVVKIEAFKGRWLFPWTFRGTVAAFEQKVGHPRYLHTRRVALKYYGPAPIQTGSSFQFSAPLYVRARFGESFEFEFGFRWNAEARAYNFVLGHPRAISSQVR